MSEHASNEDLDDLFSELVERLKFTIMRMARSALLAISAMVLATGQSLTAYSAWRIGIVVLLLGSFNQTRWIAITVLAWLTVLYLASPEILSIGSTLIASTSK